jgi:hypothetical protein
MAKKHHQKKNQQWLLKLPQTIQKKLLPRKRSTSLIQVDKTADIFFQRLRKPLSLSTAICWFLLSGNLVSAQVGSDPQLLSKRFVEIEFESTEGAISYELEVYNNVTKKFIKGFTSKTSTFKLNVKMGKYLIRSRITDMYQRTSSWSELNEMVIAPPPTKITSKAPDSTVPTFADKKTNTFSTHLNWSPLPGVDKYMVIAETPEGEKITEYKSDKAELKLDLTPGVYKFKVMAILADGTVGDASPLSDTYNILGAKILPPRLAFKKRKDGMSYVQVKSELKDAVLEGTLEYQAWESEVWSVARKIEKAEIKDIELDQSLIPGKYKITLNAVAQGYSSSESTSIEFIIKPKLPDILAIENEIALAVQGKEVEDSGLKNIDEAKKKE